LKNAMILSRGEFFESRQMANPNPEIKHLIPYKPGQSGNPGGKTSAHRQAEIEAAEIAAKIQLDLVSALANALKDADAKKLDYLTKEVNVLLKNAQDRGFGAPKQEIDNTASDGTMTPSVIQLVPMRPVGRAPDGQG